MINPLTTYLYVDQSLTQIYIQGAELIDTDAWSSSTIYNPRDAISYLGGMYVAIAQSVNSPPTAVVDDNWSALVVVVPGAGTTNQSIAIVALETAWTGTATANEALQIAIIGTNTGTAAYNLATAAYNLASGGTTVSATAAYALAQIGTNTGTAAYNLAAAGSAVAWEALVIAQTGTDLGQAAFSTANSAFSIAVIGTNSAASAQTTAGQAYDLAAQGTAVAAEALGIAIIGTNSATQAQATANEALAIAIIGTNSAGSSATANAAYALAQIGTNTGTAAYTLASSGSAVAWESLGIAITGTNAASQAFSTANSAFSIAVIGTNAASQAQATANEALQIAVVGTLAGSNYVHRTGDTMSGALIVSDNVNGGTIYPSGAASFANGNATFQTGVFVASFAGGQFLIDNNGGCDIGNLISFSAPDGQASIGIMTVGTGDVAINGVIRGLSLADFVSGKKVIDIPNRNLIKTDGSNVVLNFGTGLYTPGITASRAVVTNSSQNLVASATTDTEITYVSGVTGPIQPQIDAASSRASAAYTLASIGTNTGTTALSLATAGSNTAYAAYQIAQAGTNLALVVQTTANGAFAIAVAGTATANEALGIAIIGTNNASQAQATANEALQIAVIGTNTGTAAYSLATAGSNTAWEALTIAKAGTNLHANAPLALANGTISIQQAGSLTDGYVSTGDWNTFATKQNSFGVNATNLTFSAGTVNTVQNINTTASVVFGTITASSLTAPRIPFSSTGGQLVDNVDITVTTGTNVVTIGGNVQKVGNGNFADNSIWTFGAGWVLDAVNLWGSHSSNGVSALEQNINLTVGRLYQLIYVVGNRTVGSMTPSVGGNTLTARSTNGTFTEWFYALNNNNLKFTPTNTARLYIDSVSVIEAWNLNVFGPIESAFLTSGRIPFTTTNGSLADSSALTYASGTLTLSTGELYITGAAGAAGTNAPAVLSITGGNGGVDIGAGAFTGAPINLTTGNGTSGGAGGTGGAGGDFNLTSGTGGGGSGLAARAGNFNVVLGTGGAAGGPGGKGGSFNLSSGAGGAGSPAGSGGDFTLSSGAGNTGATGGAGGAFNVTSGAGGGSASGSGGDAGLFTMAGGTGGLTNSANPADTGGGGGDFVLSGGAGGNTIAGTGGKGGSAYFTPGAGGTGGAGSGITGIVGICVTRAGTAQGLAGFRTKSPTAYVHIAAGASGTTSAPLKFTAGTNLTTAETGAVEYDGTNMYFTRAGTTRESVHTGNSGAAAPSTTAAGLVTNRYGGATNFLGDPNSWASVVISGVTYKIPLYT